MKAPLSKNIRITLLTSFLGSLIYSSTIPFVVIYLGNSLSERTTGLVVTVNVLCSFLAGIVGGYVADFYQRKKILLLFQSLYGISLLLISLNFIGLLQHPVWIIAGYLGCGISFNLYSPAYDAVLIDCTDAQNRKRVYQLDYWAFNLSMAFGVSLGGFLFKNFLSPLFLVAAVLQLLLALFYHWQLAYANAAQKTGDAPFFRNVWGNYRIALQDRKWVLLTVGIACFTAAEFSLQKYTGIRLSQEFLPIVLPRVTIDGVRMLSILQTINTVMVVSLTFLVSRLTEKQNEKKVLLIGLLLYVLGHGLLASANSIFLLIPLIVLATIGELVSTPTLNARKVELIPDDKQASYLAFQSLAYQGAEIAAAGALTLGSYVVSAVVSGYLIILGLMGTALVVETLYSRKSVDTKEEMSQN